MNELLEAIPEAWRPLALVIFITVGAVGTALTYIRGQKKGPETPKVQEFYASGGIYDMGPVKELVEQTGLLYQQQVRTNVLLEGLIEVASEATEAYAKHLQDVEIEDEVERRLKARSANPTRKVAPRA